MIGRVALEGLEFHAFHGVYPHERESGNFFEVDIAVETDFSAAAQHDDISGTVDYEVLFQIIRNEMGRPSKLLETVVENIASDVLKAYGSAVTVEVKLSKLNPPIGGKCKKATVSIVKKR